MRQIISLCVCVTLSVVLSASAIAAGPEDSSSSSAGENSINVSPIGFLFGSYSINYERLINGSHGFIGEVSYSSDSDETSSASAFGGALGYRLHFSKTQDSAFVGAMLGYSNGTSNTTIEGEKFDITVTAPSVTMNIGRRWVWNDSFNMTIRFGVGRAFYSLSSSAEGENAVEAEKAVEDLLNAIPVTLDGELSLGWIF